MSSSYRLSLEKWLSELHVKAESVLDIGGSQLPVKGRTKSWDVGVYTIADLPNPHVGSPRADLELDLNKDNHDDISTWEIIFCLEVFEYLWNPLHAIKLIASCLRPGGRAYITFPFIYPVHQPIEDDALRYTKRGIELLAEHAGLKVTNMIPRRPETNALEMFFGTERLRAAKGEDHHVLGWIAELTL